MPNLSAIPVFRDLDHATLRAIQDELQWLTLPGGSPLFHEGEPSDAFYIVLSGCLGVVIAGDEAEPRFITRIGIGETVGEMGMITGEPRTATVIAIRYTELLGFSKSAYRRLTKRFPKLMRRLLELLARRLDVTTHRVAEPRVPKTIAIVPVDDDVPGLEFTRAIAEALERD